MSRTYRCRHLPPARDWNGSLISKVVDGNAGNDYRTRRDLARAQVEAEFGPCPESRRMVHVRGLTHNVYIHATFRTISDRWGSFKVVDVPDHTKTLSGRFMKTWEAWAWGEEVGRHLAALPVTRSSWHPHQRHPGRGGAKKFERVHANRAARHHTRRILHSADITDDWDGHLPTRRDHFNWWNIY